MKSLALFSLTLGLLLAGTEAIQLSQPNTSPSVFHMSTKQKRSADPLAQARGRQLQRRAPPGTVLENLSQSDDRELYIANITLGTPPQAISVQIDTGSSDLYVNTPNSTYCTSDEDPCTSYGTYDANKSSTYKYVSSDFDITYGDGTGAYGDFAKDVLHIGGVKVPGFQFGIGYNSSNAEGVMGIGYEKDEAEAAENNITYTNLPQALLNAGLIKAKAYSLWLNDLDASEGSILFGGVDTDKFTGELETLPVLSEDGVYREFVVAMSSVGYTNGKTTGVFNNTPVYALLDSGTTNTILPDVIVNQTYNLFNVLYDFDDETPFVPCSLATNKTTIDYTFSSVTIRVPLSELVWPNDPPAEFADGRPACQFGISYGGDGEAILGDTFLRSAYVVYDLTHNEVSLAPTKFNSTTSSIKEITNSSGIPSATLAKSAISSVFATEFASASASASGSGAISGIPPAAYSTAAYSFLSGASSTAEPTGYETFGNPKAAGTGPILFSTSGATAYATAAASSTAAASTFGAMSSSYASATPFFAKAFRA
ncbi:MAG: hypothetical protein M1819_006449 [Sarea resinae]|nr:MAG: hypothetical protein M1819_006449 [Sarea resinae]